MLEFQCYIPVCLFSFCGFLSICYDWAWRGRAGRNDSPTVINIEK